MSTTPMVSPVAPAEVLARYRSEIVRAYSLGSGEAALVLRPDAEPVVVPRAFANAAAGLARFQTLDEHAREIAERAGDALSERSARRMLEQLASSGLLSSDVELLRPRRHIGAPARITAAAVVAHDRTGSGLIAALSGAIEHARAEARGIAFMVLDDARDRAVQRQNKAELRALRDAAGVRIEYAGFAEKLAYAERLAVESGVDRAVVRFALGTGDLAFGETCGGNRNAVLLHHVGEAFLSLDDDIEPRLARHPRTQSVLGFAERDAEEIFFFADRESLLDGLEPAKDTLFRAHEAMLGHTLHDLAAQVFGRGNVDLDGMTPAMLRGLASSKARIVATTTGTYGDSGLDTPAALATYAHDPTRARLLRSELDYLTAMSSPEVLRVVRRPTVQPASQLATQSFAIDARQLLPPFLPTGRGEGALYGRMLEACFDDFFVGGVPRAVYASRSRGVYPSRLAKAPRRLADLVSACVADAPFAAGIGDARSRMALVGRHLVATARSPLNAIRGFLHAQRLAEVERAAERAEALVRAPGAPTFWTHDLRDRMRTAPDAIRADWDLPADDLPPGLSPDEAWQLARRHMRAFGELLEAWPSLYEAAQRLRVADVRVAHPL